MSTLVSTIEPLSLTVTQILPTSTHEHPNDAVVHNTTYSISFSIALSVQWFSVSQHHYAEFHNPSRATADLHCGTIDSRDEWAE
jgi:hypothetical protein